MNPKPKSDKEERRKFVDEWEETCAHCGKKFMQSQLGSISDAILQRKPSCGDDACNKAGRKAR